VLIKIREMTGRRVADMFDLIVGTSAGGLIALALLLVS
jgi:patatin-like phospholipase/acyl hydrolase